MKRIIKRGEIYYTNLDPVVGSEQGGKRPVLVLQNNTGNKRNPTTIVAPVTSKIEKKLLITHFLIENKSGLDQNSVVLTEQIRTIDKRRLLKYICSLDDYSMKVINSKLMKLLNIKMSDI